MKKIFYITFVFMCFQAISLSLAAQCGTVTDMDGNIYNTVKIGGQCWLKENLKTTRYLNGERITEIEDSTAWAATQQLHTPAWCYYRSNEKNDSQYGKLYNWYVASDARNVCPAGWHVPSDGDNQVLVDYLGGYDLAGAHLKATSLSALPNSGADNSSGFSAFPSGIRFYNGGFFAIGKNSGFWTSTGGKVRSTDRSLFYDNTSADHFHDYKEEGFSIRCIKD